MTIDPRALPADIQVLRELLLTEIAKRDERIAQLEQENRLLRKEIFAPKSERRPSPSFALDPSQMHLLFPELVEAAERVADEKQVQGAVEIRSQGQSKRPKRRKHFPPHLPVIRSTFELPMEQRRCSCGRTRAIGNLGRARDRAQEVRL
jgi:hypothetical protein